MLDDNADFKIDVSGEESLVAAAERVVAHLLFDASYVSSPTTGFDALLEDLVENGLMKQGLMLWGG